MSTLPTSVIDTIGRTPVVPLNRLAEGLPAKVFVKLEARNPGGSVDPGTPGNWVAVLG